MCDLLQFVNENFAKYFFKLKLRYLLTTVWANDWMLSSCTTIFNGLSHSSVLTLMQYFLDISYVSSEHTALWYSFIRPHLSGQYYFYNLHISDNLPAEASITFVNSNFILDMGEDDCFARAHLR